jgi:hypothetical protein
VLHRRMLDLDRQLTGMQAAGCGGGVSTMLTHAASERGALETTRAELRPEAGMESVVHGCAPEAALLPSPPPSPVTPSAGLFLSLELDVSASSQASQGSKDRGSVDSDCDHQPFALQPLALLAGSFATAADAGRDAGGGEGRGEGPVSVPAGCVVFSSSTSSDRAVEYSARRICALLEAKQLP